MHERFIARQPIFDKRLRVYAYELLFRDGPLNCFQPSEAASCGVMADSMSLFDLKTLTGNARAFMNADELALRLNAPRLLPPDRVVVEILETVEPSDEIVKICHGLHASGYVLALDDFVDAPKMAPLVELARFLKVDFRQVDETERKRIADRYRDTNLALLAEKVETELELTEARDLGYTYFQGYFFCKPAMIEARDIPGNKLLPMELLAGVAVPELDYRDIEELLKREPSLHYRLLRYLNSALLELRAEVHSVRQALSLLGENEFRRWVSIFAIVAMSSGKPPELVRLALTRGYFCEEFSSAAGLGNEHTGLFLMGLLSVVDALLDKPINEVLRSIPVIGEVKFALIGGKNRFRDVYDLLRVLERAEWSQLPTYVERLGCSEEEISNAYQAAIQKASTIAV